MARAGVAILALAALAALILACAPPAFAGIPNEAELAAGRAHLAELKETERALRAELDGVVTDIPGQRADIENAVKEYEREREQWREAQQVAKRGASWDDIVDLDRAEREMRAAQEFIQVERDELAELIKRRGELTADWRLAAWRADTFAKELKVNSTRAAHTASVGVYLSPTCKAAGPPTCPAMGSLIPLDESLPHTGAFVRDNATGAWERGPPPVQNAHRLYHGDATPRLIIDPPARLSKDLRMITIQPSVPPTPPIAVSVEIKEAWQPHAVPYLHTRLADRYCTEAIVAGGPGWRDRLLDTAAWLRSACRAPSNVTTASWLPFDVLPTVPTESPSWQRERDAERKEAACHAAYGACPAWPPAWLQWPHLASLNEGRITAGLYGPPQGQSAHTVYRPLPAMRPHLPHGARPTPDSMRRVRGQVQGGRMGNDHGGGRPQ